MTTLTNNELTDDVLEYVLAVVEDRYENRKSNAGEDDRIILALRELQKRRKADNQEPAGYHVIKECGKVGCSVATLEEAEKTRDFWNKKWTIRPYFYSAQPVPVVPEKMSKHALFEVAIARFSKMNEGFPIKRFKADWVISWMLENFPPVAQKQGDN